MIARLALLIAASLLCVRMTSAQPAIANPFGAVEAFWQPEAACELGLGWERIIFDWGQHQPESAADWNTLNVDDRWLKAANDCGREVVAVVKHTPAWATDGTPGIGVPRGLDLPIDDPGNGWAAFMTRAAAYYASRGVRRFIVWNEPDIEPGTYGYEFEGDLDAYVQLVRVASLAAKAGNPAAEIHLAGTTYWHDINAGRRPYLDRLLERITADPDAAQHGHYFSAVTLHVYFRTDTVYELTRAARDTLDRYGLTDKAIWIGEMNASPNLDPLWPVVRPNWQVTLEQQASFVVQAAALGMAAGADHIGVYKLFDWNLPPGAESFGLMRADGTRRPAFAAWRTVIEQFTHVDSVNLEQTDSANVVRMARRDGVELIAAWARTADPVTLTIAANGGKAIVMDEFGVAMEAAPNAESVTGGIDGAYMLILPGAMCNAIDRCAVGGRVTLFIQPPA